MKTVSHYCYHYFTHAQDHNIYIFNFLSVLSVRYLFLHWNPHVRDIDKSLISKWIVEVVKIAYQSHDGEL